MEVVWDNKKGKAEFLPYSLTSFARCGEGEIRTPEELAPLPLFESGAFDHSATSPGVRIVMNRYTLEIGRASCRERV